MTLEVLILQCKSYDTNYLTFYIKFEDNFQLVDNKILLLFVFNYYRNTSVFLPVF